MLLARQINSDDDIATKNEIKAFMNSSRSEKWKVAVNFLACREKGLLLHVAAVVGCDYHPGEKGWGLVKALKLFASQTSVNPSMEDICNINKFLSTPLSLNHCIYTFRYQDVISIKGGIAPLEDVPKSISDEVKQVVGSGGPYPNIKRLSESKGIIEELLCNIGDTSPHLWSKDVKYNFLVNYCDQVKSHVLKMSDEELSASCATFISLRNPFEGVKFNAKLDCENETTRLKVFFDNVLKTENDKGVVAIVDVFDDRASHLPLVENSFIAAALAPASIIKGAGVLQGNRLFDFSISKIDNLSYFTTATVRSSVKHIEYSVKMVLKCKWCPVGLLLVENLTESTGSCSCYTGLGDCKHKAALLIYTQSFTSISRDITSTSKKATWNRQTKQLAYSDKNEILEKVKNDEMPESMKKILQHANAVMDGDKGLTIREMFKSDQTEIKNKEDDVNGNVFNIGLTTYQIRKRTMIESKEQMQKKK